MMNYLRNMAGWEWAVCSFLLVALIAGLLLANKELR
jgi:hypothetical protein